MILDGFCLTSDITYIILTLSVDLLNRSLDHSPRNFSKDFENDVCVQLQLLLGPESAVLRLSAVRERDLPNGATGSCSDCACADLSSITSEYRTDSVVQSAMNAVKSMKLT